MQSSVLDIIETDYPNDQRKHLSKTLDAWMKQDRDRATWGVLELAITNANRAELALSPLLDLNTCKDLCLCVAAPSTSFNSKVQVYLHSYIMKFYLMIYYALYKSWVSLCWPVLWEFKNLSIVYCNWFLSYNCLFKLFTQQV